MKVLIQVSAADDAKAWALMVRHSPGVALPDRKFIVSERAVSALREAGIQFEELSRDVEIPAPSGVMTGERI
jgi:hypothetical protein